MQNRSKFVRVTTCSRLHFTLIDMNGTYSGRVDGGAGLAIEKPQVQVVACRQTDDKMLFGCLPAKIRDDSELLNEIEAALRLVRCQYGLGGVQIDIPHFIPAHSGFGMKTQTLLSAATAYCRIYDVNPLSRELANTIGRGGTSGIGVEVFSSGGFVVDCGHSFRSKDYSFYPSSASTAQPPAPLVGRYDFPNWPILVVTPIGKKIHGVEEQELFQKVCPIPEHDAHKCAHIVLMMLIPAVIEADLQTFCRGIDLIQKLRWKSFEIDSQAPVVWDVVNLLSSEGLEGIGMSSWGTTVFAFGDKLREKEFVDRIRHKLLLLMNSHEGGDCYLTRANNIGATVEFTDQL